MAFTLSEIMAARRQQSQAQSHTQRGNRTAVEVDEYSTNPTQAFTFYNINQGRFQPPHVHMVDPMPHDTPKPPGYTRFVCISDTHSRTDSIQMPYGDVFIHAGDFTELGLPSEVKKFNDWLGFLDWVPKKMQRVGCMELLNTVQRRVQPKLHVFGHIHEGYGMMTDGTTTFVNASACTVNFLPMNPPIVFDLPNPRTT
ncbi:Metallophosphoesterase domain-containing protein 1 [Nibea albiflora]|uniref:Metallophosphoesterase domain-containing protein 1 n=1 Tax=Nibea albiflora TaxID=240163 RepID=A0ACB7EU31_NIBAL|nr:Metallophosphoesterase domain-containing protein 1 [Nibea albiflora]